MPPGPQWNVKWDSACVKFESACVLLLAVRTCGVRLSMLHYLVGCFHGFMCMETSLMISTSCFRCAQEGLGVTWQEVVAKAAVYRRTPPESRAVLWPGGVCMHSVRYLYNI